VETYERTWQQNEELGLNDIKVEGYEIPEESQVKEGQDADELKRP
jgi:zinc finger protein